MFFDDDLIASILSAFILATITGFLFGDYIRQWISRLLIRSGLVEPESR